MAIPTFPTKPEPAAVHGRQMMLAEFGQRHGRATDQANFVDRPPHALPTRLGDVVANTTDEMARRAVRFWPYQAAIAETQSERVEALAIARKIAARSGNIWVDDRDEAA